MKMKLTFNMKV